MTGGGHDRLAQLDAAYAMDALEPDERAEFESHLQTCGECRARVAEHRDTLAMLSGVDIAAVADDPLPDTVLPTLLRRVSRERTRRRVLAGAAVAAVAAVAVTLLVALWPTSSDDGSPRVSASARDFVAVSPTPVRANASLISKSWGTQIDVHCSYAVGVKRPYVYRLQVTDVHGQVENAGSWVVPVHHDISYVTGTSFDQSTIETIQIVTQDGVPMLELKN